MGWLNKWRDDDHITLEALLDLGGGPVELYQVAGQAGIDQRRTWHALIRLISVSYTHLTLPTICSV